MQRHLGSATARALALGLVMALGAAAAGGCEKEAAVEDPPPPLDELPVLAIVELASGQDLGPLGPLLDTFQPGAGAMATLGLGSALPGIVGMESLPGVDLSGPVRLAVIEVAGEARPVLIVKVSGRGALEKAARGAERAVEVRGALALVGEAAAVSAASGVLAAVAARPAPGAPAATIFVPRVRALLEPVLAGARADVVAAVRATQGETVVPAVETGFDLLLALAAQTDRAELTVEASGAGAGFVARLIARPGTPLAGWIAVQAPSDFALAARLPALDRVGVVMAGRLLLGPLRRPAIEAGERMMGDSWAGVLAELRDGWDAWLDLFTGEFAMAAPSFGVTPTSPTPETALSYLVGVSDSEAVAGFFRRFSTLAAAHSARQGGTTTMGIVQTTAFQPGAFSHDGISVDTQRTTSDYRGIEGAGAADLRRFGVVSHTSHVAAFDSLLAMSVGEEARMRALIDAARGKGPTLEPGPALGAAVEAARARKDSAVMALDMKVLAGPMADQVPMSAVAVALGFDRGAVRLFVGVTK